MTLNFLNFFFQWHTFKTFHNLSYSLAPSGKREEKTYVRISKLLTVIGIFPLCYKRLYHLCLGIKELKDNKGWQDDKWVIIGEMTKEKNGDFCFF